MKYTADNLWKAIYNFIPSFKTARENGIYMNLPSCLNVAIVTSDLVQFEAKKYNGIFTFEQAKYRDFMLDAALKLQNESQFNFEE